MVHIRILSSMLQHTLASCYLVNRTTIAIGVQKLHNGRVLVSSQVHFWKFDGSFFNIPLLCLTGLEFLTLPSAPNSPPKWVSSIKWYTIVIRIDRYMLQQPIFPSLYHYSLDISRRIGFLKHWPYVWPFYDNCLTYWLCIYKHIGRHIWYTCLGLSGTMYFYACDS